MRTGIELTEGVFVPYRRIMLVRVIPKPAHGLRFEATLTNGAILRFSNRKNFERIKNYLCMGHPVLDDVPLQGNNGSKHD